MGQKVKNRAKMHENWLKNAQKLAIFGLKMAKNGAKMQKNGAKML